MKEFDESSSPSEENHLETPLLSFAELTLKARKIGINTRKHLVAFMRVDSALYKAIGFRSDNRLHIRDEDSSIIATLNVVQSHFLELDEIGLSDSAWEKLRVQEGEKVHVTLAEPLESFKYVRAKLHGKPLQEVHLKPILEDVIKGLYSDVHLAAFVTSCINLEKNETIALARAMSETGHQLRWLQHPVVDKHCVGGLPGNRTTMILVPIIAAFGLTIPKTSSKAVTSPAGTADTMGVLAPVHLTTDEMKAVVEKEGGCIIWGGSVDLSPADDILLQVERALDLDSKSQLIASVLSKKLAAGSTHVLIDIPLGPTAKVRYRDEADNLTHLFYEVGKMIGLQVEVAETDGRQPVGRGIGPALEARDVLSVLRREKDAPQDLRDRSLFLAGKILEFWGGIKSGDGFKEAQKILADGRALKKFEAICEAQGGMREPKLSSLKHVITAIQEGVVLEIDNRILARIAKLAGAPDDPCAGVDLHVSLDTHVVKGQPLFTIYADSKGELTYALHYFFLHQDLILIGEKET